MSERYKLVYRGEVLEGQHAAVVRRRLSETAGFAEDALEKLFSGKPVVLKRDADQATAARLQGLFRKAGARLRVLPVDADGGEAEAGSRPAPSEAGAAVGPSDSAVVERGDGGSTSPQGAAGSRTSARGPESSPALELFPAGSVLLREHERTVFEPREVDTSGLRLDGARFTAPEPQPEEQGPDVSHLSIADVGADLGPGTDPRPIVTVNTPAFDVAAPGSEMAPARKPAVPAVDVDSVSFEVAPAGSEILIQKPAPPPPPPDVSHLSLETGSDRDD